MGGDGDRLTAGFSECFMAASAAGSAHGISICFENLSDFVEPHVFVLGLNPLEKFIKSGQYAPPIDYIIVGVIYGVKRSAKELSKN